MLETIVGVAGSALIGVGGWNLLTLIRHGNKISILDVKVDRIEKSVNGPLAEMNDKMDEIIRRLDA
jgi:hypothetical protein